MKRYLMVILGLCLPAQAWSLETEMLRCVRSGRILGAPVYSLVNLDSPAVPRSYYLKMTPQNPTVRPSYVKIPRPVFYGNTWIATKDSGRSGYAHIYSRGALTVIDVNLFQPRERHMNTPGALTSYRCSVP